MRSKGATCTKCFTIPPDILSIFSRIIEFWDGGPPTHLCNRGYFRLNLKAKKKNQKSQRGGEFFLFFVGGYRSKKITYVFAY